jgi:hypothetical protein
MRYCIFSGKLSGVALKNGVTPDAIVQAAIKALSNEHDALMKAGVPDALLNFILVRDWMESGAYSNNGYKLHNNPGNIMWNKNDKYGTKGTYNAANKTYYSHYPTIDAYVQKAIAVLKQKPGIPYDATTKEDFVHRLKLNNYFGKTSEADYLNAMKGAAQRINLVSDLQTDTNQNIVTTPTLGFLDWIKANPIKTAMAGTLGLIIVVRIAR